MKKTIILSFALLFMAIFNYSLATDGGKTVPSEKLAGVTNLVVNAHVTIVLVNNSNPVLEVVGNRSLSKQVEFQRTGNTLVIKASKYKDLTGAGVIYISANELRSIQVNADANIRSLNTLQIASLDVLLNGICEFTIHNIGEVNLTTSEKYTVEQNREERTIPASVLPSAKKYSF